jgi:hypothetical protein
MLLFPFFGRTTHGMGGEITWHCQGSNSYVFELIFYRDCNGFEVNTVSEDIRVWGHPTLTEITVVFIERIDISPICTPSNGISELSCGTGAQGGNGAGAVEKIIYRSNAIDLGGTPVGGPWYFTFDNFSRNGSLSNLMNPTTYGITLSAGMFPIGPNGGTCIDNSPTFLQDPYVVSCAGINYTYNPHAVDQDLDSLVFSFAPPLDYFPTGVFNPPSNPIPVPFEAGFSSNNPTPDGSFNSGNQPSVLNTQNGKLTFKSFTLGNFASKIRVESYRNGVLIAYVEREIQLVILACDGNNDAPVISAPFNSGSSFDTTVFAGDLVSFTLESVDLEFLQDGSNQSNYISASGLSFGTDFTDPSSGCDVQPCATLNTTPLIIGDQGSQVEFNWQTSCDHLVDATGNAQENIPYLFVFKVQDNYCPVPQVTYATVTINVMNEGILNAPVIECIETDLNNNLIFNWTPVNDPNGDFVSYSILENNFSVANIPNINSTFYLLSSSTASNEYELTVQSGCNGLTSTTNNPIENIHLILNNSGNGEAQLNWNDPIIPKPANYNDYYHIYKEYPAGNWFLYDSVPYGITSYVDTITFCSAFINYQIILNTNYNCNFSSNIAGDLLEDAIVPNQPIINTVSIDTLSGEVTIIWNQNSQEDTYGYVLYTQNESGFLVELDTIWGIGNTTYSYLINNSSGPLSYSVAAFDSCFTDALPPTYQTSAKAEVHTTSFLEGNIDVCNRIINLNWTDYVGFENSLKFEIWGKNNLGSWQLLGSTDENLFSIDLSVGDNYEFVIKVIDTLIPNLYSLSNKINLSFTNAGGPTYSYIAGVNVQGESIGITHKFSLDGGVNRIRLEKFDTDYNTYLEIDEKLADSDIIEFIDPDVEVDRRSYQYRTLSIDTCDQITSISNIGKSIYLTVTTIEAELINNLQWSPYELFLGNLKEYRIYRGLDGIFDSNPIGITTPFIRTWTDTLEGYMDQFQGKVCYVIEAIEGANPHLNSEVTLSNVSCPVFSPQIYVPNAFTIGGNNPMFIPITSLHNINFYELEIYDRLGRQIFKTNIPNMGWDGIIEKTNRYAREGIYVYRLKLVDGKGSEIIKHGHVTLLDYR